MIILMPNVVLYGRMGTNTRVVGILKMMMMMWPFLGKAKIKDIVYNGIFDAAHMRGSRFKCECYDLKTTRAQH